MDDAGVVIALLMFGMLFVLPIIWAVVTSRSRPARGVGGWLAWMIYSMYVLAPLVGIGTVGNELAKVERQFPNLLNHEGYLNYKTACYVLVGALALFSIVAAFRLHTQRTPSAVRFAKWFLWTGVASTFATAIIANIFLDAPLGKAFADIVPSAIGGSIGAAIWTAYLSMSKRVRATYYESTTPEASPAPSPRAAHDSSITQDVIAPLPVSSTNSPGLAAGVSSAPQYAPRAAADPPRPVPPPIPAAPAPLSTAVQAAPKDNDDLLFEVVGKELQDGTRSLGLWTRVFAEADGDENRARAMYIRHRVEQLRSERQQRADSEASRADAVAAYERARRQMQRQALIAAEASVSSRFAAEIDELRKHWATAFLTALSSGNVIEVRSQLTSNPRLIRVPMLDGTAPLTFAVRQRWPAMVMTLLQHGAKDATDDHGATALSIAEQTGELEIAEMLRSAPPSSALLGGTAGYCGREIELFDDGTARIAHDSRTFVSAAAAADAIDAEDLAAPQRA